MHEESQEMTWNWSWNRFAKATTEAELELDLELKEQLLIRRSLMIILFNPRVGYLFPRPRPRAC